MAESSGNISPETVKLLAEIEKRLKGTNEELSRSQKTVGSLAGAFLGISDSDFFRKIKKSDEDIASMTKKVVELEGIITDLGPAVNKSFTEALGAAKISFEDISKSLTSAKDISKEMGDEIKKAVQSGNFSELSSEAMKAFKKITTDKDGFNKLEDFFKSKDTKQIQGFRDNIKEIKDEFDSVGTQVFSLSNTLKAAFTDKVLENFKPKAIMQAVLGFDQTLTEAQRKFDIGFKNNSLQMADLSTKTAAFGMSLADTTETMGVLSSVMRTTNVDKLAAGAEEVAKISRASGLAASEATEMVGEFSKMGIAAGTSTKLTEKTMQSANAFGISGAKIMKTIASYAPKFRQMGFQGGVESLSKMALMAEHLGQNVDEIFDMAKRARNIEGAISMAAELQLAGSSFANINPMDLLAAARKSPMELQKILASMGSDIGNFDETTKEMTFSPVDIDRLQIVSDATGMSLESLQNQITKTKQDANKLKFAPGSLLGDLDPEEKAFLAGKVGKNGKLEVTVDGISDLSRLTKTNIDNAIKTANKEKQNIEDMATQNTGFTESLNNLKTVLMNSFVVFEPAIRWLTTQLQSFIIWISGLPAGFKVAFASGIAAFALLFGVGKQFISGLAFGKGHAAALNGGGLKSLFKKGGGAGAVPTPAGSEKMTGAGPGDWLKGLASGLEAFAKPKILMGAGILAGSVFLIGGSLGLLAKVFSDISPTLLVAFGFSLVEFGFALNLMSKAMQGVQIGAVLQASLAIGILSLSLIPLAYAVGLFDKISLAGMGKAGLAVIGMTALILGLGAIMYSGIGAALLGGGILAIVGISLAIAALGASMYVAGAGFEKMAAVNWAGFENMGSALLSVIPGLLAISGVGLLSLPGLMMMIGTLSGLTIIMSVLSPALENAASSSMRMAEGIEKMKEALKNFDTSKLNELADVSDRMATSSTLGAIGNAINSLVGSKEEKTATQKIKLEPIEINLKLNGRDFQEIIIKDNKFST